MKGRTKREMKLPGRNSKPAPQMTLTDAQIKHMVDRFLGWRLPRDTFNPDCGISFDKKPFNVNVGRPMLYEPSGTNLFDAEQATAMVRYMLDGLPR